MNHFPAKNSLRERMLHVISDSHCGVRANQVVVGVITGLDGLLNGLVVHHHGVYSRHFVM